MKRREKKTERRKERDRAGKATLRTIYYTPSYKGKICRTGSVNGRG